MIRTPILLVLFLVAVLSITSVHAGREHKCCGDEEDSKPPRKKASKSKSKPTEAFVVDPPADSSPTDVTPTINTYGDEETKAMLTIGDHITYLPGLELSPTPIPEPNDPELPNRSDANVVDINKLHAYCNAAPKMSAPCALLTMCQRAGEAAPSYICGSTPLAGLVCNVDKDVTTPGSFELCSDYNAKCTSDDCKAVQWPHFHSSPQYQIATFKMCDDHAKLHETMRGCDECAVPPTGIPTNPDTSDWNLLNTTCHSFKTYGDICTSMPGTGGCVVWRTMCAALPNAAKVFPEWCNGEAMAAGGVVFDAKLADIKYEPEPQKPAAAHVLGQQSDAPVLTGTTAVASLALFLGMVAF